MTTQIRIPHFSREDLDLPVNWQTINEVHIPLSYACRKILGQVVRQFVVFIVAMIPLNIALLLTFRPFMHEIKPLVYNMEIRANIYIAVVVVLLWLLSRLCCRTSLKRLQFLLHIIPILSLNLLSVFAGG